MTLPLAPLADLSGIVLPWVVRRMQERLTTETDPPEAAKLWTATFVLMGLKYRPDMSAELLKGVTNMRESATYQWIVDEGRVKEAQAIIQRLGGKRFGTPAPETIARLEGVTEIVRLEQLSERLLDVESWDELLS